MRNIIILGLEILLCYIFIIFLYKKYKTDGLLTYAIITTIISNILSLKEIDILTTEVPLGMGLTISIILVANIITQKRGKEEVNNLIILVLIASLISCCFLNLSGLITPSEISKYANKSYDSIFEYNLRVYIANTVSLVSAILISSRIYYSLKRVKNKIILSNIFSIIIIEFIDNIFFIIIAYIGTREIPSIILAITIRYAIKTLMGIIGTVPIYIIEKQR